MADSLAEGVFYLVELVKVLRELDYRRRQPLLLAIAGGSCSGKSLLARRLREELEKSGLGATIVALDNYCKGGNHPQLPRDHYNRQIFDLPQSYWLDEFLGDVVGLLKGREVRSPVYDKAICQRLGECRRLQPQPVIIAEGLFTVNLSRQLPYYQPITIFLDCDEATRTARRLARDAVKLHRDSVEAKKFIIERVEPYYRQFVLPQKEAAELLISTNH